MPREWGRLCRRRWRIPRHYCQSQMRHVPNFSHHGPWLNHGAGATRRCQRRSPHFRPPCRRLFGYGTAAMPSFTKKESRQCRCVFDHINPAGNVCGNNAIYESHDLAKKCNEAMRVGVDGPLAPSTPLQATRSAPHRGTSNDEPSHAATVQPPNRRLR